MPYNSFIKGERKFGCYESTYYKLLHKPRNKKVLDRYEGQRKAEGQLTKKPRMDQEYRRRPEVVTQLSDKFKAEMWAGGWK